MTENRFGHSIPANRYLDVELVESRAHGGLRLLDWATAIFKVLAVDDSEGAVDRTAEILVRDRWNRMLVYRQWWGHDLEGAAWKTDDRD
jgi:hypothetical protein